MKTMLLANEIQNATPEEFFNLSIELVILLFRGWKIVKAETSHREKRDAP